MALVHLDTHVATWLWAGDRRRLRPVWKTLRRSELAISPAAVLELGFLFEIGRIQEPAPRVVEALVGEAGLHVSAAPLSRIVDEALSLAWTRDPFDRLIVANARVEGATLLTRDGAILDSCPWARWS